jgi:RNA polymerase sigma-70 factor (ECF subfamily)
MPDEPEVMGLLALMLLTESRRGARSAPDGGLVPLAEQDRTRWDGALVAEGQAVVRQCLRRGRPGQYQIQAAISAVHSDAPVAAATGWDQIVALYDQLLAVAPGPVAALNRAVAVAEVDGPAAALALVDGLAAASLDRYYLFHAIRADLLRRLGRRAEADAAYQAALALSGNEAERAHLALAKEHLAEPDGVAEGDRQAGGDHRPEVVASGLDAQCDDDEREADGTEDAHRHRREEPG